MSSLFVFGLYVHGIGQHIEVAFLQSENWISDLKDQAQANIDRPLSYVANVFKRLAYTVMTSTVMNFNLMSGPPFASFAEGAEVIIH